MRVILKQEVSNLGDAGDIVTVSPGYGRNLLIPQGLAVPANEGSVSALDHQQKMAEAIKRKQLALARELATKLEGTPISIRRETGDDDRLFGSVTKRDVAEALAAEGVEIDRKQIVLDEALRSIGLFNVPVRLHREVTATVRVYVIRA
ncbi:MAG: large subunit ribosomal protein L9 [Myxococcota bacterium]|jgi:large subunit ribosomal protein L9